MEEWIIRRELAWWPTCPIHGTPLRKYAAGTHELPGIGRVTIPGWYHLYTCEVDERMFEVIDRRVREVRPVDVMRRLRIAPPPVYPPRPPVIPIAPAIFAVPPVGVEEELDFEVYLRERKLTREEFELWPEPVKLKFYEAWRRWRLAKYGHPS